MPLSNENAYFKITTAGADKDNYNIVIRGMWLLSSPLTIDNPPWLYARARYSFLFICGIGMRIVYMHKGYSV